MSKYSFPLAQKPEIDNCRKFRKLIVDRGIFSKEENDELYEKVFARGPRRRLYNLIKKYNLDQQSVIDVGCGYGHVLLHLGIGSYGVDNKKDFVNFAKNIGLTAHHFDAVSEDLSHLPKVDNAICWAIMEHVDSQHLFLRNLHSVLNPGGRLFLYVPTVPVFIPSLLPHTIYKYWIGHTHGDHVNFYTARSLKSICERAGFKTISCNPGFYGPSQWLNYVPGFGNFVDGVVYIGESIPNWQYPRGSRRKV